MNKSELIDAIAEQVGGRSTAAVAVDSIIGSIERAVTTGERVVITGFGVFEKADRAARVGRNPATGASVRIKKSSVPKFRAGTEFKAYVNGDKKFPRVTKASAARAAAAPAAGSARPTPGRPTAAKAPAKTAAKAPAKTAAKAPAKTAAKAPTKTSARAAAKAPAKTPARAAAKAPAKTAAKAPAKTAAKAPAATRGTRAAGTRGVAARGR